MHQKRGTGSNGLIMNAHALIGYEWHFPLASLGPHKELLCRNLSRQSFLRTGRGRRLDADVRTARTAAARASGAEEASSVLCAPSP